MRSAAEPAGRSQAAALALSAAGVVVAGALVYWPSLAAGFVGDDFMILDRLAPLARPADVLRFFQAEFFEYYRPLGFVSHAIDWAIAGPAPRQFHRTNLALHLVNGLLVLGLAWSLARAGSRGGESRVPSARVAGPLAALLFVLHASNHEAVAWVSARFDLLASAGALAAIWWTVASPGSSVGPALLYFAALLSKESVVALPAAVAAWWVFCRRATTRETIARLTPWLIALVAYAVLRQIAGGVPATGGAARLPKVMAFGGLLALLLAGADGRWQRWRDALLIHSRILGAAAAAIVACSALVLLAPDATPAALAREKLTVAGFAVYYLLTPFTDAAVGAGFIQPPAATYARAAVVGLPLLACAAWVLRRRLAGADAAWFLVIFFIATMLPVSALTEGRRYLYLPSAVVAIAAGLAIASWRPRPRAVTMAAMTVFLLVSAARIVSKLDDWVWAGTMTAAGARLVDDTIAPACDEGHVVFLTSPVGVRGVYTHFYYETFTLPRGCKPEVFQIVARVMRVDTKVEVRWTDAGTIELQIPDYRGNLVLSRDLRHFDLPLDSVRTRIVETPIGVVRAEPDGTAQHLTVSIAKPAASLRVFYFSEGRIWKLPDPPRPSAGLVPSGPVLAGRLPSLHQSSSRIR